jgi:hypothetical protein
VFANDEFNYPDNSLDDNYRPTKGDHPARKCTGEIITPRREK